MVVWLKKVKINVWNWRALKFILYFTKYFLRRNIVSPLGKHMWLELFKFLQTLIFFWSHFWKFGTESCLSPSRKGVGRGGVGAADTVTIQCEVSWAKKIKQPIKDKKTNINQFSSLTYYTINLYFCLLSSTF